ncbi:unnamed protein product, partial [Amoebophrya sp. A25]|eukprot:GSA25T00013089001.1
MKITIKKISAERKNDSDRTRDATAPLTSTEVSLRSLFSAISERERDEELYLWGYYPCSHLMERLAAWRCVSHVENALRPPNDAATEHGQDSKTLFEALKSLMHFFLSVTSMSSEMSGDSAQDEAAHAPAEFAHVLAGGESLLVGSSKTGVDRDLRTLPEWLRAFLKSRQLASTLALALETARKEEKDGEQMKDMNKKHVVVDNNSVSKSIEILVAKIVYLFLNVRGAVGLFDAVEGENLRVALNAPEVRTPDDFFALLRNTELPPLRYALSVDHVSESTVKVISAGQGREGREHSAGATSSSSFDREFRGSLAVGSPLVKPQANGGKPHASFDGPSRRGTSSTPSRGGAFIPSAEAADAQLVQALPAIFGAYAFA